MKKEDIKNYQVIRVQLANMLADRINAVVSKLNDETGTNIRKQFEFRDSILARPYNQEIMIYSDSYRTRISDDDRRYLYTKPNLITLFDFESFLNPKYFCNEERQTGFYLMLADAILDDMCKENRLYVDIREDDGEDDDE